MLEAEKVTVQTKVKSDTIFFFSEQKRTLCTLWLCDGGYTKMYTAGLLLADHAEQNQTKALLFIMCNEQFLDLKFWNFSELQ